MKNILYAFCLIPFYLLGQTHVGETTLVNNSGRTLVLERDDDDSWLTFHDPNNSWFSMGIDKSNLGYFSLNNGGSLSGDQFIMDHNGKIGIGINPTSSAKLEVNGDILVGFNQFIRGKRSGGVSSKLIGYIENDENEHILAFSSYTSVPSEVRIFTPTDPNQGVSIYSDKRLVFFRNDGNVGIGVDNPSEKLVVDGNIRSEEIKVEIIDGPDYVFESDYWLRSLSELREYIKINKHLPEIPSAKEMEDKGVNLGEMNMLLLKKIEELTLYTLDQDNKFKEQDKKIKALTLLVEQLLKK